MLRVGGADLFPPVAVPPRQHAEHAEEPRQGHHERQPKRQPFLQSLMSDTSEVANFSAISDDFGFSDVDDDFEDPLAMLYLMPGAIADMAAFPGAPVRRTTALWSTQTHANLATQVGSHRWLSKHVLI